MVMYGIKIIKNQAVPVLSPNMGTQIFDSELTAGVITDALIYFACIFMQTFLPQEWVSERYPVIGMGVFSPKPSFLSKFSK